MMHEGHSQAAWAHTSEILAVLAEPNRDPKKRTKPFTAADFNPHHIQVKVSRRVPDKVVNITDLKDVFVSAGTRVREIPADHIRVRPRYEKKVHISG